MAKKAFRSVMKATRKKPRRRRFKYALLYLVVSSGRTYEHRLKAFSDEEAKKEARKFIREENKEGGYGTPIKGITLRKTVLSWQ